MGRMVALMVFMRSEKPAGVSTATTGLLETPCSSAPCLAGTSALRCPCFVLAAQQQQLAPQAPLQAPSQAPPQAPLATVASQMLRLRLPPKVPCVAYLSRSSQNTKKKVTFGYRSTGMFTTSLAT